jgi:hypothetical protein
VLFAGVADEGFLSSVSYAYFGIDARHYAPLTDRITLATHAALRYLPVGKSAPFWALGRLGGDRSVLGDRQALRGYGDDRFIDNNVFAANIELRSRVLGMQLFSTQVSFEVAPFVDVGRVFQRMGDNPLEQLHWVGGVGVRGIAKPHVVGYVDAGYGEEGIAVFSGIDYPF